MYHLGYDHETQYLQHIKWKTDEEINEKNSEGHTYLFSALTLGQTRIAEYLINHPKIKINDKNRNGETVLHRCHGLKMVKLIIEKGADINAKDNNGKTPLYKAIEENSLDIAECLINHPNINVNEKEKYGKTALHICKELKTAELLIEKGADVHEKDNYGKTPLDYAIKNNRNDIADFLRKCANIPSLKKPPVNSEITKDPIQDLEKRVTKLEAFQDTLKPLAELVQESEFINSFKAFQKGYKKDTNLDQVKKDVSENTQKINNEILPNIKALKDNLDDVIKKFNYSQGEIKVLKDLMGVFENKIDAIKNPEERLTELESFQDLLKPLAEIAKEPEFINALKALHKGYKVDVDFNRQLKVLQKILSEKLPYNEVAQKKILNFAKGYQGALSQLYEIAPGFSSSVLSTNVGKNATMIKMVSTALYTACSDIPFAKTGAALICSELDKMATNQSTHLINRSFALS